MNHPEKKEAPADLVLFFDRWIIDRMSFVTHDMINSSIPSKVPNLGILELIFQESLRDDVGVATWKSNIKGL